jgi:hypothetical protein
VSRDARDAAALAFDLGDQEGLNAQAVESRAKARAFLTRGEIDSTEGEKVKVRKRYRAKTLEWLMCLNNALAGTTGYNMEAWRQSPLAGPLPSPERWPTLVLNVDQGSDGYAAQWFLRYGADLCVLFLRDDSHRKWNNARLALHDAGVWGVVTLTCAALNGDHAPWEEARWFAAGREAIVTYMALTTPRECPLFCSLWRRLLRDRGQEDQMGREELEQEIWAALPEAWTRSARRWAPCAGFTTSTRWIASTHTGPPGTSEICTSA